MSWSRLIRRAGTALLASVALTGAAQAATMVVRSAGPVSASLTPGKAIADTMRIVLGPNDSVTLLDAKGTRTLKGPGTFTPQSPSSATAAGTGSTLAALVTSSGDKRARIGAVRGATFAPTLRAPNIWYANVGRSATICIANPGQVTMWRPGGSDAAVTSVSGSGRTEQVQWIAGQTSRAWPESLPISDGATYTVGWPGGQTTTLKFAVVGAQPDTAGLQDMAAVLIKRGCQAQLDQLIDTAAIAPTVPSAG